MKIAIVTETFLPSTDGVVTRMTHAIDYMLSQGHEVLIIAPDVPGIEDSYKGARVIGATAMVFPFYKERPWALPNLKVKEWLSDFDPDIVHCVNPISLGASGVHYAEKLEIPMICSFHTNIPAYLDHYHMNGLKPFIWGYLRNLHNKAPINLVTSNAMYELLDENDIRGLRVLPKGVDSKNLGPENYNHQVRKSLTNGHQDEILLIFVGRLAPEKGIDTIKPLLQANDHIHLAIVGDGPEMENLQAHFKETNTIFTGYKHGKDLAEIYASADAFIFPSSTETLGLVITEAMVSGTPVIAAESEPTKEQIKDDYNGLLYDPSSLRSLEYAVLKLDDADFIRQIKENGYRYASQYSWENASRAMVDAYYETIDIYKEKPKSNISHIFSLK